MDDSQSQEVSLKDELDLRAALQEAISNICVEEEIDDAVSAAHLSSDGLVALSELVYQFSTTTLSSDLRLFSKHAGRRTIQVDDVLLAARKDPDGLLSKLRSFGGKQDMPAFRNNGTARGSSVAAVPRNSTANRSPATSAAPLGSSTTDPWLNIDSSSDEEANDDKPHDPDGDETQTDDDEKKMPAKESTVKLGDDSVIELDDSFDYSDVADTAKENVSSNRKDAADEKDPFESSSDEDGEEKQTLTARLKRLGKVKANPGADSSSSSLSSANSPRRRKQQHQKSRLDADNMMDDDLSD